MSAKFTSYLNEVRTEIDAGFERNVKAATLLLHREVLKKLRGKRTGNEYRVPGGNRTYRASAPGESPANRTGRLFGSYDFELVGRTGRVGSPLPYALMLERGTSKMRPRPALKPALTENQGKIERALSKPLW